MTLNVSFQRLKISKQPITLYLLHAIGNWIEKWIKIETYQDVNKVCTILDKQMSLLCHKYCCLFMEQGRGPINCNLTGKPAILDRLTWCLFFWQTPRGHLLGGTCSLCPSLGTPLVFENGFAAITSLFFTVGRKEYHFWNQWISLHMTQVKP